ncbi:hypothetical protein [Ancylobacter oerskovii]|uniref:Uncharacterized protein n=1 Tax=Ancylobacter oerskovii TaxID=459519 RepID=A0ABW4YRE0_9HYPH|nr:hypothetical protein [Ancylobacter oerskovii]MBS7545653.1 hypothetical protein [Ancylobacter oerskovii]
MEDYIIKLQRELGEAKLILECSAYLLETEHRDPSRWREMIAIHIGLVAERVAAANNAAAQIEQMADENGTGT